MNRRHASRRTRRWAILSLAGSACAHVAVWGAAVGASAWWLSQLPVESPVFAGRREVIQIESAWAVATPPPALPVEIMPTEPVEVRPTEARIEQSRLTTAAASDLPPLPMVEPAEPTETSELTVAVVRAAAASDVLPAESSQATASPAPPTRQPSTLPEVATTSVAALPQPVGSDETIPTEFLRQSAPNYPLLARQRGWQGVVLLRLSIGSDGAVTSVAVERSSGYAVLDAEAVAAVRTWRGTPARRGGQVVPTEETLPIRFRL
jgi:periplasmic protein TonB